MPCAYSNKMKAYKILIAAGLALLSLVAVYFGIRSAFPRPHADVVEASGLEPNLVYSVVKAESGFDEKAVSRAGAVGLMQLLPSTAKFVCTRNDIPYEEERLSQGDYNLRLGCLYLHYLLEKFPAEKTALAAYNAGEGVVAEWLADPELSSDGATLARIPYPETAQYVKKIAKIKKFYDFFY